MEINSILKEETQKDNNQNDKKQEILFNKIISKSKENESKEDYAKSINDRIYEDIKQSSDKVYTLSKLIKYNSQLPAQGTKEWKNYRKYIIGGSDMDNVINGNYGKIISSKLSPVNYDNIYILWGKVFENVARIFIEKLYNTPVYEFGVMNSYNAKYKGYSMDGMMYYNKKLVMLEFKTVCTRNIIPNKIPDKYICQVLSGLSDFEYLDYAIYLEIKYKICNFIDLFSINSKKDPLLEQKDILPDVKNSIESDLKTTEFRSAFALFKTDASKFSSTLESAITDAINNPFCDSFKNILDEMNTGLIQYINLPIITDKNVSIINKFQTKCLNKKNFIGFLPFYLESYNIVKVDPVKDYSKQFESKFEDIIRFTKECEALEIYDDIIIDEYVKRRKTGDLQNIPLNEITVDMINNGRPELED